MEELEKTAPFLSREEAMRLYKVVKDMDRVYGCLGSEGELYRDFARYIISAAHLSGKFEGADLSYDHILELGNVRCNGVGYLDWYADYWSGGRNAVLEGCGLLVNSLDGAMYFDTAFILGPDDLLGTAEKIISQVQNGEELEYADICGIGPMFDDDEEVDEEDLDFEEVEADLVLEFAEGVRDWCQSGVFDDTNHGLMDFLKVCNYLFDIGEDAVSAGNVLMEHLTGYLRCVFGGGGVMFYNPNYTDDDGDEAYEAFNSAAGVRIYLSERAVDAFSRIDRKDPKELTEEERVFIWACDHISGSDYQVERADDVCGCFVIDGELNFNFLEPEYCDSSGLIKEVVHSYARLFAPLILDALS